MRHAGLDVDEIAGLVFDRLFQAFSEFVPYFSLDDIEDYFEADMPKDIGSSWRVSG